MPKTSKTANKTPKTQKILVAYDGSAAADSALRDLSLAGLGAHVEALVLTACEPGIPAIQAMAVATDVVLAENYAFAAQQLKENFKAAKVTAAQGAWKLQALHPQWTVRSRAVVDSPAHAIVGAADRGRVSLIVMGSTGHSGLERLLLGSVTQKVVTHATRDIRVSRPRKAARAVAHPRIVLALDGSADSDAVLAKALQRHWPTAAEFRVVTALDFRMAGIGGDGSAHAGKGPELARRIAAEAVKALSKRGYKVSVAVREGDAREVIVQEVERFKANGLLIGCRGLHALGRFMLGSVSAHAAQHAPCTVEILRKGR